MNSNKPLASLVICFYNQEKFVEDAFYGAISQNYDNLEIVLSDDCSSDDTFQKLQSLVSNYKGNHQLIINRNTQNMGLVSHMNKVLYELSKGDYIFMNGGDDISLPNRISDAIEEYSKDNTVMGTTCASIFIDGEGNETGRMNLKKNVLTSINDKNYLLSPSMMCGKGMLSFRRDVLDSFGQMNPECQTEDSVLRFRILLLGKMLSLKNYGVKYRIHGNNISIGDAVYKLKTHPIAEQYRKDFNIVRERFPETLVRIINKKIDCYEFCRKMKSKEVSSKSTLNRLFYKVNRKLYLQKYYHYINNHYLS